MSESEFGRGYATCLRQFTFHRTRLTESIEDYRRIRQDPKTPADLFTDEAAVEMWANGASDHLYELIRPVRDVPRFEWSRAQRLGTRALNIGHGFRQTSKSNPDEAHALLTEAAALLVELERRGYDVNGLDEAMTTDRALGLRPDAGQWSCREDISRREAVAR